MNKEIIGGIIGTGMSAVGTATQTNEVLQTVSIVLTIIGTLLTITMAILNWWKNAKKDGKIDEDEIQEGIKIISDGVDALKDTTDKENKK